METIRHWALTVCICCVLVGALKLLLPTKGAARGIKTVLALYILLSACEPVPKADWTGFWNQLRQMPEMDTAAMLSLDDLAQKQFGKELEETLTDALNRREIRNEVHISGTLDTQAGTAHLESVRILLQDPKQMADAKSIIQEYLGPNAEVEYGVKDGVS